MFLLQERGYLPLPGHTEQMRRRRPIGEPEPPASDVDVDVDVSAGAADVCAQQGASQAAERVRLSCTAPACSAAHIAERTREREREKDNQRALDVVAASAALLMRGRPAIDGGQLLTLCMRERYACTSASSTRAS